jgi:hypothetical protein
LSFDTAKKYNGTGASAYGEEALIRECVLVSTAADGTRNNTLNTSAFNIGQLVAGGELEHDYAFARLINAAIEAGLSNEEAERTAESGMDAGMETPRSSKQSDEASLDETWAVVDCPDPALLWVGRKPEIQVNNRQLEAIIHDALDAIYAKNKASPRFPIVYVRGGALTTVATDEEFISSPVLLSVAGSRGLLCQVADWIKIETTKGGGIRKINVPPPPDVPATLLSWPGGWPEIPPLEGVVNVPVFGSDGSLHVEPGYNPATRLFYPGGVNLGNTEPTLENVANAKALLLDELLYDFPFKMDAIGSGTSASKAHALAMMILPFVRPMINGPTPLHLIDSPTPGTGKGLLGIACAYPALGHIVASVTAGKDEDEWRKRITSFLRQDGEFILIDNISTTLDSGSLASALTQPVWKDRVLGYSDNVRIKIRSTWAATGNNVPTSKEIARRTVWIRLDANCEKPWERTGFKHEKLTQWCKQNRDRLVTAIIILVQNWIKKGPKPYGGKTKGSYEEWTDTIGGILETNGIPGFLENEDELHKLVSSEGEVLRDFITAWARMFGTKKKGVGDLFELASFPDDPTAPGAWSGLLDALLGTGKQRSRQTKFGQLLNVHRDAVFTVEDKTYKVSFEGIYAGEKQYALAEVSTETPEQLGL